MKFDIVYSMIAVTIGLLFSYGLWSMAGPLSAFILIGSAIYLCATLVMIVGVRHENSRTTTNLSVLSGTFFVIGLAINIAFCFVGYAPVIYMMVSAISFLVYLAALNALINTRQ